MPLTSISKRQLLICSLALLSCVLMQQYADFTSSIQLDITLHQENQYIDAEDETIPILHTSPKAIADENEMAEQDDEEEGSEVANDDNTHIIHEPETAVDENEVTKQDDDDDHDEGNEKIMDESMLIINDFPETVGDENEVPEQDGDDNEMNEETIDENTSVIHEPKTVGDKNEVPEQDDDEDVDEAANESNQSFPNSCTWQCYLRQNPDVLEAFGWDETVAKLHYEEFGVKENRVCSCKIVLLAGPHKAASTTLQFIAQTYSNLETSTWKWLSPTGISSEYFGIKGFFPLVQSYFVEQDKYANMKSTFLAEIMNHYRQGYNIILGSEEIDRVVRDGGDSFVDELLDILPPRAIKNDLLTTLVVYRSPRISHLLSCYKQLKGNNKNPELEYASTFHRFFNTQVMESSYYSIESLKLVDVLTKKGLSVQLLDMSGMKADPSQTFYKVLGCDVMGMDCVQYELNDGAKVILPEVVIQAGKVEETLRIMTTSQNVRDIENPLNLTDTELDDIDGMIKKYDCSFANTIQGENVKILYGHDLLTNMNECKSLNGTIIQSFTELIQSMRNYLGYPIDTIETTY